ncbi:hypothetical protein PC121_g6191 [Phytophthora cactorum]|nr:hypothetical protein PC121_g6191 [Phytophthora cactorum]
MISEKNTGDTTLLPVIPAVVNKLAEMASHLWDPVALVCGDLDYRAEVEVTRCIEPRLSEDMPDERLLEVSRQALLQDTFGGAVEADTEIGGKLAPQ